MKRSIKLVAGVAAALGLGLAVAAASGQHSGAGHGPMHGAEAGPAGMHGMAGGSGPMHGMGPGRGGPMHGMGAGRGAGGGHGPMSGATAMLTTQDAGSAADMGLVHELLVSNDKIQRTVTRLHDGIRTVTESDDPDVARAIQAHVSSMSQRLDQGREFNIFSKTLPVLFQNREKIKSTVEMTDKGIVVTRTSDDSQVVAALQGHADEVSELVQDGMAAMHRGMRSRMAMGGMGPGQRGGERHQR